MQKFGLLYESLLRALFMSCFSPISVINPTISYKSGFDPVKVQVPCGHCLACRKKNQNDWVVRMFAEWRECIDNGGLCAFPTLTYRPANVPIWTDGEFSEMVFSHEDITNFMKKMRTYAFRRFGITDIRYIIFAEYGSKGTHRPHYHVLLFFPPGISDYQIKALIRKAWIHGIVGWSSCGAFVTDTPALLYCSKYASKDLNFFGKKVIAEYLLKIRGDEEKYKEFKQHLPKHFQSKGFGKKYLMRYLDSDKLDYALNHGIRFPHTERVFMLPEYIFRSSCYSYNQFGVRYVNDFGARVLSLRTSLAIDYKAKKIAHDFTRIGLASILLDSDVQQVTKGVYDSIESIYNDVQLKMAGRSFEDLIYYANTYRNRSFRCNPLYIFDHKYLQLAEKLGCDVYDVLCDTSISTLTEYAKSMKYYQIVVRTHNSTRDVPEETAGLLRSDKMYKGIEDNHLFNDLPQFKDFDYILELYTKIVSFRKEINLTIQDSNAQKAKEYKDKYYFSINNELRKTC